MRRHHQHRSPGGGLENFHPPAFAVDFGYPLQPAFELGQDARQHILAAQVGDGALFDVAVFAVRLDDAYRLVDGAVGGWNFNRADVQAQALSRLIREESSKNK